MNFNITLLGEDTSQIIFSRWQFDTLFRRTVLSGEVTFNFYTGPGVYNVFVEYVIDNTLYSCSFDVTILDPELIDCGSCGYSVSFTDCYYKNDTTYVFKLCLIADDPNATNTWLVTPTLGSNDPPLSGSGPNPCFEFNYDNPGFFFSYRVDQTVNGQPCTPAFGSSQCPINGNCISLDSIDCNYNACFSLNTPFYDTNFSVSYGDTSSLQILSDSVFCHTYADTGTYRVCVTGVYGPELPPVTCCREFEIRKYCCPDSFLTYNVINCPLGTNLMIDFDSLQITDTSQIVSIDLGDGNIIYNNFTDSIYNEFPNPGDYDICITFNSWTGEVATCCQTINIQLPPECNCPPNILDTEVVIEEVEDTCQYKVIACLNQFSPCDSTTHIWAEDGVLVDLNDSCATFEFPGPGYYEICMTCPPIGDSSITCCETVYIHDYCLNPYFTLDEDPSPNCIKPLYCIEGVQCPFSNHTWYFPDGSIYEDFIPSPGCFNFTDFVSEDGYICIKHVVEYCGEKDSMTVCVPVDRGAYLGNPGTVWRLSDTMPSGKTVLQFIVDNQGEDYPLFIEGELIIDVDWTFDEGTWNMGRNAQVTVEGLTSYSARQFYLTEMVIQSAARLDSKYSCCRWNGIVSYELTDLIWAASTVSDAKIGLHYPRAAKGTTLFPTLQLWSTDFIANWFGIKSVNQEVQVPFFENNTFNGAPHDPEICGCDAVNAIDFRNGTGRTKTLKLPFNSDYNNKIFNYEQAFHFENFNAELYSVDIYDLKNYAPVNFNDNPLEDAVIGVDYHFSSPLPSTLKMDYLHFHNFQDPTATEPTESNSLAVSDKVTNGLHELIAISSSDSTIKMSDLWRGYKIENSSSIPMVGKISKNKIDVQGKKSYGILGRLSGASFNDIHISDNNIETEAHTSGSLLEWNGGIGWIGLGESRQKILIEDNIINVLNNEIDTLSNAGILIHNCAQSRIRNNKIDNGHWSDGIILSFAPNSFAHCNHITHGDNGILVKNSKTSFYYLNNLSRNKRDMYWFSDNRTSSIRSNTFNGSEFESVLYNADGQVGQQNHTDYNLWKAQDGVELKHENPSPAYSLNNLYWYPGDQVIGDINHPNNRILEVIMLGVAYDSTMVPTSVCSDQGGTPNLSYANRLASLQSMLDSIGILLQNLEIPVRTSFAQSIYGEYLDYPELFVDLPELLDSLELYVDMDFVEASQLQFQNIRDKKEQMSVQYSLLEEDYSDLNSLYDSFIDLIQAAQDTPSISVQQDLYTQASVIAGNMESKEISINSSMLIFENLNQSELVELYFYNDEISTSSSFQNMEKTIQRITIKVMLNIPLTATELNDIRTIAQTCYDEGGRAVFMAQSLAVTLLEENYELSDCEGAKPFVSTKEVNMENQILVAPNPARDAFTIYWPEEKYKIIDIDVYDLSGRKLFSGVGQNGQIQIDCSNWITGIYIVRFNNVKELPVKKVQIQRN